MKKQIEKIGFEILSILVLMMAALAGSSVYAQDIRTFSTGYEFGPGAGGGSRSTVSLRVPARATIMNANTTIRRDPGPGAAAINNIPLRVEFKNPEGGNATGAQLPSAGVVQIALPDLVNPFGTFRSQKGCNDTWKIIIKTPNGSVPAARVWGTVTFIVMMPFRVDIDMIGSSPELDAGEERDRDLTAHDGLSTNSALIAGPGIFQIRAKWDTHWWYSTLHGIQTMRVQLRKPNGSWANEDEGSPSGIDFTYRATQADANLSGRWKVRVKNQEDYTTVGFDIENWPSWNSTFQGSCSGGSSITAS